MKFLRAFSIAVSLLLFFDSAFVYAQNGAKPYKGPEKVALATPLALLLARNPVGSITSIQGAERALTDVSAVRLDIEAQFSNEEKDCYAKFFATSCLDDAKERRRLALSQVRRIEIEANAVKRLARARVRELAEAQKRAQAESEILQREKDAKQKENLKTENKASARPD